MATDDPSDKAQQALANMRDANSRVREGRVGPQYDAGVRDGRASRDAEVTDWQKESLAWAHKFGSMRQQCEAADAALLALGEALVWLTGKDGPYDRELLDGEVHWHDFSDDSGVAHEHDGTPADIIRALLEAHEAWRESQARLEAPCVCPGCHTVGGGPCAPGCVDAEIEAETDCEAR